MKILNAFVHIALVGPILVAAHNGSIQRNSVRGKKTIQRKLTKHGVVEHYVDERGKGKGTKSGGKGYTDDDYYHTDDDWYEGGKGTSKGGTGGKGTKSGSKGGKGKGGKSKGGGSHGGHECEWYMVILNALQPPSAATFPENGDVNDIGTSFIYNSPLFDDEALTIPVGGVDTPGFFVTGSCVRFQASSSVAGTEDVIAGAGGCDWTYTISLDKLEGTVAVTGELFDSVESTMAIVGGTGMFIGAEGEVGYIPTYAPGAGTDVFTDASYYNMTAALHFKVCDPYYHYE
jgi:hypothetical protein